MVVKMQAIHSVFTSKAAIKAICAYCNSFGMKRAWRLQVTFTVLDSTSQLNTTAASRLKLCSAKT
eukprot:scaffold42199_cov20-Prasinocladus_malaysianus.AAC.1